MDDDPWGRDTPPAVPAADLPPLPPRLAELAALSGPRELAPGEDLPFASPDELPEVRALAQHGWLALDGAPMWSCLPAVWPVEHRCWVPDRLPPFRKGSDGRRRWVEPWDTEDFAERERALAADAAECGLPAPPAGRLWLLRSPWPSLGVSVVRFLLVDRSGDYGLATTGAAVTGAARVLLRWAEEQVWESWRGPEAEAAVAWRRLGRTGEVAADVVLAGLGPSDVAALTEPGAEAALTEPQAVAWARALGKTGHEAVRTVRACRAVGLPPDPPEGLGVVMEEMSPDQVAEWLAAGFGFDDVVTLCGLALEQAVAWRTAGFAAAEVRQLLRADRTLTPAEASAFTDAGITGKARIRWVETGFDAAEARDWTELDVLPDEARVWRSVGKGPADARDHRQDGGGPLPPDVNVGWTAVGRNDRATRRYGVVDPEGTRGVRAHENRARRERRDR